MIVKHKRKVIAEVCPYEGSVSLCCPDGRKIGKQSKLFSDLANCCKSGDCQNACEFVLEKYEVEWRIVRKMPDGNYENALATDKELRKTAKTIYFESSANFADRSVCETYLIWQGANDCMDTE